MRFYQALSLLSCALAGSGVLAQSSTGTESSSSSSASASGGVSSNSTSTGSLAAIEIHGNAFFNSETGERFYIRGVDYQPGGSSNLTDPLADVEICSRDIPYFKELGLNTVRVYTVDNSQDHTECMNLLKEAGIYLILDLNTPGASISRIEPKCSYNADYLQSIFATVDQFAKFDNTLGFFAGNEVINSENTTDTATYVKATVRDVKKYIKARDYRQVPVGYSAADVASNRQLAAEYFNCGDDADARIDMFGVNDYSWCGSSSFQVSGYATKMDLYQGYSTPIFLSEFGCNKVVSSRPFTEIGAIYSTKMSSVFSGGLVYEYSMEDNKYGLVEIDGDKVTETTDFTNLKDQLQKVSNPEGDGGSSTDNKISECPVYQKDIWEANNTLPEMPDAASIYFKSGAGEPMGTGIITQEMCEQDNENAEESSSSTITETSSTSSSSTSSSASKSSAASSSSASSSTSSSSSKSKDMAGSLEIPSMVFGLYSILTFLL